MHSSISNNIAINNVDALNSTDAITSADADSSNIFYYLAILNGLVSNGDFSLEKDKSKQMIAEHYLQDLMQSLEKNMSNPDDMIALLDNMLKYGASTLKSSGDTTGIYTQLQSLDSGLKDAVAKVDKDNAEINKYTSELNSVQEDLAKQEKDLGKKHKTMWYYTKHEWDKWQDESKEGDIGKELKGPSKDLTNDQAKESSYTSQFQAFENKASSAVEKLQADVQHYQSDMNSIMQAEASRYSN